MKLLCLLLCFCLVPLIALEDESWKADGDRSEVYWLSTAVLMDQAAKRLLEIEPEDPDALASTLKSYSTSAIAELGQSEMFTIELLGPFLSRQEWMETGERLIAEIKQKGFHDDEILVLVSKFVSWDGMYIEYCRPHIIREDMARGSVNTGLGHTEP